MASFRKRFGSASRLRKPEEFRHVFASKRRSGDRCFLFLARKNDLGRSRLGLAVPKKHIRLAVERNRLKRIIRESFRLRQKALTGNDIVVVVRNKIDIKEPLLWSKLTGHWDKIIK